MTETGVSDVVLTKLVFASVKDPESYAWDPLDASLLRKLDTQKYVSLSLDRRVLAAAAAAAAGAATTGSAIDQPGAMPVTVVNNGGQTIAGNAGSMTIDDDDGEEDDSDAARSLFRAAMPGVMSLDDVVRNVDLGQIMIRLVIRSCPMIRPAQVRRACSAFTFHHPP